MYHVFTKIPVFIIDNKSDPILELANLHTGLFPRCYLIFYQQIQSFNFTKLNGNILSYLLQRALFYGNL